MSQPQFDIHATDLGFPEGPVALADGAICFVDLLHGLVRRWHPGEGVRVLARLPGAPNGMCLAPDGRRLLIANNGGLAPEGPGRLRQAAPPCPGGVQLLDPDNGNLQWMTRAGEVPERPNDLIVLDNGAVVFTDPQNWETLRDNPQDYRGGRVLICDPDGQVRVLAVLQGFPNGLLLHPDGSLLVNLSRKGQVWRFDWTGPDEVGPPELFCQFSPGFAPDGMCLSEDHLLVAGSVGDCIGITDLSGRIAGTVPTGAHSDPTNLCLSGGRVFITLGFARQLVSIPLNELLNAAEG